MKDMAYITVDEPRRRAILKEIGTTEEELEISKDILREWVLQNPHLPQMSDILLLGFLLASKNSLEKAKERLELYYTRHLSNVRESFIDTDPTQPEIQKSFDMLHIGVCRLLTPEGLRVQIIKIADPDPTYYEPGVVIKRVFMMGDLQMRESYLVGGECIVFDCTNVSMGHLKRISPMMTRRFYLSSKLVPCRLKKIIVINALPMLDTFVAIAKTMISEKLRNRLYVYSGDHTNIYQHIPKEILPKDYGGDDVSLEKMNEYWRDRCLKARDWFLDSSIHQTDESKRVGGVNYRPDQLYGPDGSFKSLAID